MIGVNILKNCFTRLTTQAKRRILGYVFLQLFLSLMDLVGIALLGAVASISINSVNGNPSSHIVENVVSVFKLENASIYQQVVALSIASVLVMIMKSLVAQKSTRKIMSVLNVEGNKLSATLLRNYFLNSENSRQNENSQESLAAITTGAMASTVGVVGYTTALIADFSLLGVLLLGLVFVSPAVTLAAVIFFSLVGVSLHRLVHSQSRKLSADVFLYTHQSSSRILEILYARRELWVNGNFENQLEKVISLRSRLSTTVLELSLLPNLSKYVIEISLVLGSVLFAGFEFVLVDSSHAITSLAVFLAAGSRIAPALLRIQQNNVQIGTNIPLAEKSLSYLDQEFVSDEDSKPTSANVDSDFNASISINNVSFSYATGPHEVINNFSLEIYPGEYVAIVGPSGAGKSTLVDMLIGVISPDSGEILLSGFAPKEAVRIWPGKISYVPQQTFLTEGTLQENVAFGESDSEFSVEAFTAAIKLAQLEELSPEIQHMRSVLVVEGGRNLSGGQRQRIGIARAMYTNPQLLIMDEATSSLDAQTESFISSALLTLKGSTTIINVAHRLSSIMAADKVIYLERGKIPVVGSFDEVRRAVPNFDTQANLLGIDRD